MSCIFLTWQQTRCYCILLTFRYSQLDFLWRTGAWKALVTSGFGHYVAVWNCIWWRWCVVLPCMSWKRKSHAKIRRQPSHILHIFNKFIIKPHLYHKFKLIRHHKLLSENKRGRKGKSVKFKYTYALSPWPGEEPNVTKNFEPLTRQQSGTVYYSMQLFTYSSSPQTRNVHGRDRERERESKRECKRERKKEKKKHKNIQKFI